MEYKTNKKTQTEQKQTYRQQIGSNQPQEKGRRGRLKWVKQAQIYGTMAGD